MAKGDRLLKVTRARVILPAAGTVWSAAAVLHAAHVSALDPGLVSLATALAVRGSRARPLTRATVAAGAWLTAATAWGPMAGPHGALTWLYGAGTLAGLLWANWHPAVREAREWRDARFDWLSRAHHYGLGGSHMVEHERTRLGDRQVFDTTGTHKLASRIAAGSLAELIAQEEGLPLSRVQVRTPRPGLVEISRRFTDPWKHPIAHPLFDADPEIDLSGPATVRKPLPVGQDPESGKPLEMVLWDEIGAKVVQVVAKRGAGKTTLINSLRERITACPDADLWDINLSKAQEDREWAPVCEHSACGPDQRQKAFRILRAAHNLIDQRGATPRDDKVFIPTPTGRLKVLVIDEVDALVAANPAFVRAELAYIASKARSEGVVLVIVGQRATADWIGGGNVKANIDYVVLGKVRSPGEVQHAAGSMGFALPDMTSYGEGKPGVWVIAEHGGDYQVGRSFKLDELTDIRKIAAQRAHQPEPVPVAAGSFTEPLQTEEPSGIDHLDSGLLEEALDPAMRDLLAKIDATNADTRRINAESEQIIANLPDVPPEKMRESAATRWRQVGEQAEIPEEARGRLMALLAAGTTIRPAAEALGVSVWTMRTWLQKLRDQGIAVLEGEKKAARWRLARQAVRSDEAHEPDRVYGPGELSPQDAVMLVATWGLRDPDLATATERAREMGMPGELIQQAMDLLANDREHVIREARRALTEAGAPIPPWLALEGEDGDSE